MTLENRAEQMRTEMTEPRSIYSVISAALKKDGPVLYGFFERNLIARNGGAYADPVDIEIAEVYDLKPEGLPSLSLPSNLSFVSGFNYVTAHWYPIIETSVKPNVPDTVVDYLLEQMFPDRSFTAQQLRDILAADPTGADWLGEMARAEFTSENLELAGALKAIGGIRKMHEALTAV